MDRYPRGTVAFFFTDIAGSTRLWQDYPDAMARAYARHDAVLRAAVVAHDGVVYKVIGDAIQAAFPTSPRAAAAAVRAQLGLAAEDWLGLGLPEPLRVRMALHAGAVDPDPDGDYRSSVLNRLGRLLGAAHGGQILLSQAARGLMSDAVPPGAQVRDLGEHRLKDLALPERVFQLVHADLPANFPPLVTLDRRPHNLPTQLTSFIGRGEEIRAVGDLLNRPDVRLLTLTGTAGVGKTRLALQVAAEVIDAYADGAFFVDLAPVADTNSVASAIAGVVGVHDFGDRPLRTTLTEWLAEKQLLLIVDNFEQVVTAGEILTTLLAAAPRIKTLVTSRSPLRTYGERTYLVSPMALPDPTRPSHSEQLTQYEAVQLFIARAEAVAPRFSATAETIPVVAEICRRLDGLPLAIELAAAWVNVIPLRTLLTRLEHRLPLLTGGPRNLPLRQQTMRSAIAWSYDLLDQEERALFRRLAVFAGGATLDATEAVCHPSDGLDLLEGLEALVGQSLVRQEAPHGEPRYMMLATLREFGLEQLELSGEADPVQSQHAQYFVALVERAGAQMDGPVQRQWLDRLEREHENVRTALEWAFDHHPEMATGMVAGLWRFWEHRGHLSEGWMFVCRALATGGTAAAPVRARVLLAAASIGTRHGEWERARAFGRKSLQLYRLLRENTGISQALVSLGILATAEGEFDRASAFLEEALRVSRKDDDKTGIARALTNLGYVAYGQGAHSRSRALLEEGIALLRQREVPSELAASLAHYGHVLFAQGETVHAVETYRESLLQFRELGGGYGLPECLFGLAAVALVGGRTAWAARLLGAEAGLREALSAPVAFLMRPTHERVLADACEALGARRFDVAFAAGRALTPEEAVIEALTRANSIATDVRLVPTTDGPIP